MNVPIRYAMTNENEQDNGKIVRAAKCRICLAGVVCKMYIIITIKIYAPQNVGSHTLNSIMVSFLFVFVYYMHQYNE